MLKTHRTSNERTGYILKLRQSRAFRGIALTLALNIIVEMIHPTISWALTEGPSQPEVQSFEPIGTTQMVDLFTGDFNYNIPLFNLPGPNGGYPVNLAYHAGISMDDEASWVGLGWNINPGALVRNMRGLPDEFLSIEKNNRIAEKGFDHILVKSDMKPNRTFGVSAGFETNIFGGNPLPDINEISASIYYNNYRGVGISLEPSFEVGKSDNFSLGIGIDSENGLGISPTLKMYDDSKKVRTSHKLSIDFDGNLSIGYSISKSKGYYEKDDPKTFHKTSGGPQGSSSFSFARNSFATSYGQNVNYYSISGGLSFGISGAPFWQALSSFSANFSTQDMSSIDVKGRRVLVSGYDRQGEGDGDGEKFLKDFARQNDGQITKSSIILPNSFYTYDTYNSTGQGLIGYFRPRRNDVGRVFDALKTNESFGVNFALQVGVGLSTEALGSLGGNFGYEKQGPWDNRNDLNYDFANPTPSGITENLYYQAHGEQTVMTSADLAHLGGLDIPTLKMDPSANDGNWGGKRKIDAGSQNFNSNGHSANYRPRFVRNTLIHKLTNREVHNLKEFEIHFYNKGAGLFNNSSLDASLFYAPGNELDRSKRKWVINDSNGNREEINIDNHNAGFKVLNEEGSYYVYGLPAYNNIETENLFSTSDEALVASSGGEFTALTMEDGEVNYKLQGSAFTLDAKSRSHKFIEKTTKTPYPHSYLLTSVQGADYVDVDNNGPSDDDLGYWVKFDYIRHSDQYKWRAPYNNAVAQYHQGQLYHSDDDKASYQYGEKELWYVGRMETKSHIAIFITEDRFDNRQAMGEYLNSSSPADNGLRLKEIRIYSKDNFSPNATPLQTVHFEYDYALCQGVPNNTTGGGKLTLRRVYFTSLGSKRGEESPYVFDYSGVNLFNSPATANTGINPNYQTNAYDPWGNFKIKSNFEFDSRFPYTNQFNQEWNTSLPYTSTYESDQTREETQQMQDEQASAWCLNKITLPSGGEINIDYESDDYGYVQHKTANQMFKIHSMGKIASGSGNGTINPNELYQGDTDNNEYYDTGTRNDEVRRRIYFKLEYPVTAGQANDANAMARMVYNSYIKPMMVDEEGKRNLYFKTKMELVDGVEEYVSGYLPLEEPVFNSTSSNSDHEYNYGVDPNNPSMGFVTIQAARKRNKNNGNYEYFDNYHPMALAGWTYLQTNAQEILNNPNSFNSDNVNENNFLGKVLDLVNFVPQLMSSLGSIRKYCKSKNMARYIEPDLSCIRLASPDKRKFGGGHRVKNISITDNWGGTVPSEQSRTYGQHYEYTIDEDGKTISSGVAQYEPQAGGDENALKYPIFFFEKASIFTRNNIFSEAPVNESLFPGASVGYRKVTVKSLNTDEQQKVATNNGSAVGRTGGISVHEFYTAKDFPTTFKYSILSEGNDTKSTFNLPIPIPFVGTIKRTYYHGVQSFLVETNDMHGKPKSVRSYELNGYLTGTSPITESTFEYQAKPISYQGENVFKLDNNVKVIPNNGTHIPESTNRLMGVEVDLFTDQRESKNFSASIGLDFGAQFITVFPVIITPELWITHNNVKSMFRTFVNNKVVHRSGILKKSKSRDLQTINETEVLAYDEKSGTPLLTKVKNEFGNDFYSYNIPAYYHYDRMGHAYRNINYTFTIDFPPIYTSGGDADKQEATIDVPFTGNLDQFLVRGDELLILSISSGGFAGNQYQKGYYLGTTYGIDYAVNGQKYLKLHFPDISSSNNAGQYTLKVIRSGRRNHYGTMAANYLTKNQLTQASTTNPLTSAITSETATLPVINNVLSATASLFKDDWTTTNSEDLSFDGTTRNPFLTGNSGIWRPYKSYTYVGERKGTASMSDNSTTDPNLREDGIMDNVPMFSWEIGNMEEFVSNWEWVNEVSRFSQDAYELENVNRLGIYSSALYGYDNSLTIAVGGNASIYELGAYDFETDDSQPYNPQKFAKRLSQTNMNFGVYDVQGTAFISEQYNITKATSISGNVLEIETDIPYAYWSANSSYFVQNIGITLTSMVSGISPYNEGYYFNGKRGKTAINNGGFVKFTQATPYIDNPGEPNNMVKVGTKHHGKIALLRTVTYNSGSGAGNNTIQAEVSSIKSHTGKKSLKVTAESIFEQPKLKTIAGKKYVVSLWVSRDNEKVRTYEPTSTATPLIEIGEMDATGFTPVSGAKYTFSKKIEGWQKIDVEFEANSANMFLAFKFLKNGTSPLYVDDIRYSPKTGGITTYVYDPNRFWLRASLNVDNYATFFYYDEEGNLTIKKQETEEGIFTITESRGHVKEN